MAYIFSCVSQKGGVGKSCLSQMIAMGYGYNDHKVLIADMDVQQKSSCRWLKRRQSTALDDVIDVQSFATVNEVLARNYDYDLIIFDGAAQASAQTLEMSIVSHLIILPTGPSRDDMDIQVMLANELKTKGVPVEKILFIFNKMGSSEAEKQAVFDYMKATPYRVLDSVIDNKISYCQASDAGKPFTRSKSPSLNVRAMEVWQGIAAYVLKNNNSK